MMVGNPTRSSAWRASSSERAMRLFGHSRPISFIASRKASRSSATSMAALRGADQVHAVARERAVVGECQRRVERGLPAHGRQQGVRLLGSDDAPHDVGRDRLDIGCVGELGIGHDRRRVRVHQDDPVAFVLERLAGLRARIVELAGLADHDGAGPDHHDRADVGAPWHGVGAGRQPIIATNRAKRCWASCGPGDASG